MSIYLAFVCVVGITIACLLVLGALGWIYVTIEDWLGWNGDLFGASCVALALFVFLGISSVAFQDWFNRNYTQRRPPAEAVQQ
jgi:hypothetical protein